MTGASFKHPLKWWQFYAACVRFALSGLLGLIGDTGTILGVIIFAVKSVWPASYAAAAGYLSARGFRDDALIEIPLWVGAAILSLRLLAAPFFVYRDKPWISRDTLDVRLEGTFPGTFALNARGHACEIRTSHIVNEGAIVGIHQDGERKMPVWYPRCGIEFPLVSDLANDRIEIEPSLFYYDGHGRGRSRWPENGTAAVLKEFLRAVQLVRRHDALQAVTGREDHDLDVSKLSTSEAEAIGERIRQPIEFAFDITYWNSDHTEQWQRQELFVYEPQTETAFVRHIGAPVRLTEAAV